jgi:hypothetical protein
VIGNTEITGGDFMKRPEKQRPMEDLRLDPQLRLCPKFDATSIAEFPVAKPGEMGMRVLDNCAEEHIM